jgi:hypothetical protein
MFRPLKNWSQCNNIHNHDKNISLLLKSRFGSGLWIVRKIYENLAGTEINWVNKISLIYLCFLIRHIHCNTMCFYFRKFFRFLKMIFYLCFLLLVFSFWTFRKKNKNIGICPSFFAIILYDLKSPSPASLQSTAASATYSRESIREKSGKNQERAVSGGQIRRQQKTWPLPFYSPYKPPAPPPLSIVWSSRFLLQIPLSL